MAGTTPSDTKPLTETNWPLVGFGILLVLLFGSGIGVTYAVGTKTTVVGQAGSTKTVTVSGTATTTTVQANQTTTKKGGISDVLLEAILATGVILILVGFLYDRITTIKVAGVGEIDLSSDEVRRTAVEAQKAADKAEAPPEAVSGITATAIAHAREEKRATKKPLTDVDIEKAVQEAAAGYMDLIAPERVEQST